MLHVYRFQFIMIKITLICKDTYFKWEQQIYKTFLSHVLKITFVSINFYTERVKYIAIPLLWKVPHQRNTREENKKLKKGYGTTF